MHLTKRSRKPPAAPQKHAPSALRRAIAQRVANAHEALAPGAITAMLFGSTVIGIADERSDIDMSIVFETIPAEAELLAACERAGGGRWTWRNESPDDDDSFAVGFDVDGIEVQIAYTERRILDADLDTVLVAHDPTTLNHKIAEGLLKAEALLGAPRLQRWRERVAQFPPALGDAMMRHHLAEPTPWKWFTYLLHRDSALWCREMQVDAGYRLFGTLAGLNRQYFTVFQFKRMHRFAEQLRIAPPNLADRVETLLAAPLPEAFAMLYALEGEVLALVAEHAPQIDLTAVHERRKRWVAPVGTA
jgi:hypothetical protein